MKERALIYEEFIALAKANYTKGGIAQPHREGRWHRRLRGAGSVAGSPG